MPPELRIKRDPALGSLRRGGDHLQEVLATATHAPNQPGLFQHTDMAGDRGLRHVVNAGERGDVLFAGGKARQQAPTRGVRQRCKDQIELGIIHNELVIYYRGSRRLSSPGGQSLTDFGLPHMMPSVVN